MATDHLNVSTLYKLTCQAVADELSKMSMSQVQEYLKMANDYTTAEERALNNEFAWPFD